MKLIRNVMQDTIEHKRKMKQLEEGLLAPIDFADEDLVITIKLEEYKELLTYKGKYLAIVEKTGGNHE